MLYKRKKRDPVTGGLKKFGPWWIKYYRQGRPFYESTETDDKTEARRKLKERKVRLLEACMWDLKLKRPSLKIW